MSDPNGMKLGGLFAGYGGLELAAGAALGAEPAWFIENDPGACAVLEHHYPHVPNLGDITQVDFDTAPRVDVLTSGWPCQPWSYAGSRRGCNDDRALWTGVARAVRALRPAYVLLENVPGIITAGELGRAADSLAACGYEFAWTMLGADAVGAPHKRDRLFIAAVADADRARELQPQRPLGEVGGRVVHGAESALWRHHRPGIERWGTVIGRPAPEPSEYLRCMEWLMGLPNGWVTGAPGLSRDQQLKLLGNGVVPQQAAAAFGHLLPLLNSQPAESLEGTTTT